METSDPGHREGFDQAGTTTSHPLESISFFTGNAWPFVGHIAYCASNYQWRRRPGPSQHLSAAQVTWPQIPGKK